MTISTRPSRAINASAALLMVLAFLLVGASSALANPFAKGPDPTLASVDATAGPFAYTSQSVSRGNGFGGGTLYYPTTDTPGTFAAVSIAPGFSASSSTISWWAKALASHGFVALAMQPKSTLDFPDSRATQLLASLDWMRNSSSVKTRIDGTRLGVLGQSMGGGATLRASKTRPSLKGAFATAPYNGEKSWSTNIVPQFLMGMENDSTAGVSNHALKFYNSLPSTTPKIYAELRGASHSTATSPNTTIRRYMVSWIKRWLDEDTRYSQFLCPAPPVGSPNPLSRFLSNCPF